MDEGITIRDVMSRDYVGVSESDTLEEVGEMMVTEKVSGVVVIRGSVPVGIVTERQLLSALVLNDLSPSTPIGDIMVEPDDSLDPTTPVVEAIISLSSSDLDHLVVATNDEIQGLISATDLVLTAASLLTDNTMGRRANEQVELGVEGESITDDFSTQSVCEVCGGFAPNLQNINGQLVCPDCRSV